MDILTNEIREILARIRDLEDIALVYSDSSETTRCAKQNTAELIELLNQKVSTSCKKQLKIQKEMSKLGTQEDMFD